MWITCRTHTLLSTRIFNATVWLYTLIKNVIIIIIIIIIIINDNNNNNNKYNQEIFK